ncbi:TadE/TadG family type IV pilus assembly protein [Novosphingobium sp.]|jgi:hypothetical protein|uniref:TadE/TadG family type IV pilus assembly protein n=1 Tax=Novosphingobium sp. TaxID=1874826 RepID=UPI002FE28A46
MIALLSRVRAEGQRLLADRSGVSVIEFALVLPILTTLGMYGTEVAYMAMVNMQVGEIATSVADNASRLGQTDNTAVAPTVKESDVDSVMWGALSEGASFNFVDNGRIILSSLEVDPTTKREYIHWQRCRGSLARASSYGVADTGKTGNLLNGMGKAGAKIHPVANSAVMYVEVYYRYQPLFGTMFVKDAEFKQEAAFIIRDNRTLNPTGTTGGVTGGNGKSLCT